MGLYERLSKWIVTRFNLLALKHSVTVRIKVNPKHVHLNLVIVLKDSVQGPLRLPWLKLSANASNHTA